jgi:hypothetical protein
MSGKGFHVHGPHDHEVEHQSHAEPHGMAGRLAVATAIIATVGAIFAYMGGLAQLNAGLYKNESAIKKTEAANQWAFYQAKSNRQYLSELAEIQKKAEELEKESLEWGEKTEHQIHEEHRWQQATTALQISIALAAIALLTRSRRLQYGVYGVAGIGVVLGVLAWMSI